MSHTIFLIIALVTTGIFLIQFVLSIFFGDIDADVDVDATTIEEAAEEIARVWKQKNQK